MPLLSYSGYRFPGDIIQRAVWMYLRFTLSFRDVEELLAEQGIVVTYGVSGAGFSTLAQRSPATCAGCDPGQRAGGTWTRW
jgi:hypothetical protein